MKLRVARSAVADLDEIWAYLASRENIEVAERVVNSLVRRFGLLAENPGSVAIARISGKGSAASRQGIIGSTTIKTQTEFCKSCMFGMQRAKSGSSPARPRRTAPESIPPVVQLPDRHQLPDDIRREYRTAKDCAPRCTVACVHQVGHIDNWRRPQDLTPVPVSQGDPDGLVQLQ